MSTRTIKQITNHGWLVSLINGDADPDSPVGFCIALSMAKQLAEETVREVWLDANLRWDECQDDHWLLYVDEVPDFAQAELTLLPVFGD